MRKTGLSTAARARFIPVQNVVRKPHQVLDWKGTNDLPPVEYLEDDSCRPIDNFSPMVRLFAVDSATGERKAFSITLVAKAREVKERVSEVFAMPMSQAKLSWRGQVLADTRSLISYHIEPGECIHVIRRPGATGTSSKTVSRLAAGRSSPNTPRLPTIRAGSQPQSSADDELGRLSSMRTSVSPDSGRHLNVPDGVRTDTPRLVSKSLSPTGRQTLTPQGAGVTPRTPSRSRTKEAGRAAASENGVMTLGVYAIEDGVRPHLARMEIKVREADRVLDVKQQIEKLCGVQVGDQRICFGGRTLANENALGVYGIRDDSARLQLVVPFGKVEVQAHELERNALYAMPGANAIDTGKFNVMVREIWPNGKRHRVALAPDNTISVIKERVQSCGGLCIKKQTLLHRGRYLNDDLTADFYNLEGGDFIDLISVGGAAPAPIVALRRPPRMKPDDDYPFKLPEEQPLQPVRQGRAERSKAARLKMLEAEALAKAEDSCGAGADDAADNHLAANASMSTLAGPSTELAGFSEILPSVQDEISQMLLGVSSTDTLAGLSEVLPPIDNDTAAVISTLAEASMDPLLQDSVQDSLIQDSLMQDSGYEDVVAVPAEALLEANADGGDVSRVMPNDGAIAPDAAVEQTVAEAPIGDAPVAQIPTAEVPALAPEALALEVPAAEAPAAEAPNDDSQVADAPAIETSVAETAEAPAAEASATDTPVAEAPAAEATPAEAPKAPVAQAPTTEVPAPAPEAPAPEALAAEVAAETPAAEAPKDNSPIAEVPAAEASAAETPAAEVMTDECQEAKPSDADSAQCAAATSDATVVVEVDPVKQPEPHESSGAEGA